MHGLAPPRILALCGDPGGASAVAPVIRALRAQGRVTVQALAYRQAGTLWAERNVTFEELDERIGQAGVVNLLCNPKAALLLTGASLNAAELEKRFIAAACENRVASLTLLDFWSNYARRFSDRDGRLVYVPDRIALMDEQAYGEMVTEGFDAGRLVITGQPAFDDLAQWRSRFTPLRRQEIRRALRVEPRALLVLFVSQPLSVLYGMDALWPDDLGFTEQMVLGAVVRALDQIVREKGQDIVLAVRPHPREEADWLERIHSQAIRIVVSREERSRDLAMAADLVVGMNTGLLVEACYLGCVALSVQPGLRLPDALPTNRSGHSRAVYRQEEIKPVLEEMLLDKETRMAAQARLLDLQLDNGATQRVVKLVYQMIGLEQEE